MDIPEYALELLLAYDGRLHYLASGHYLKFEVKAVEKSPRVPHGIAYSLTLHAPDGKRLLGFDNAHPVPHRAGVTSGESPKPTTGTARRLTRAGLTNSSRWSGCWKIFSPKPSAC